MTTGEASSDVSYDKNGMSDKAHFEAALAAGVPLCIENAHLRLQGEWDPRAFIEKYGSLIVTPIDCLTGEPAPGVWTVERYFNILVRGDTSFGILKLKVRSGPVEYTLVTPMIGLAVGGGIRRSLRVSKQGLR